MFENSQIAFVGAGTMGEAMIHAVLARGLVTPHQVAASDALPARCQELSARHGIRTAADNAAVVAEAEIVILAVKPQVLPAVLGDLEGKMRPGALALSIVAGARLSALADGLQVSAIVRAMPNTPAQIGEGITVWTATDTVSGEQRSQAEAILQAMGKAIYVHDERQLDMATALSGSGPAYVFLIMEAMVDAGVRLGFARPIAEQLVMQTVLGSARFAAQSGQHLAELRNMVTSPGGTTAEALYHLEKGAVRAVIGEAIAAAYEKSCLLAETR
jgi:pyrroline-5-carboxylate reductase